MHEIQKSWSTYHTNYVSFTANNDKMTKSTANIKPKNLNLSKILPDAHHHSVLQSLTI